MLTEHKSLLYKLNLKAIAFILCGKDAAKRRTHGEEPYIVVHEHAMNS